MDTYLSNGEMAQILVAKGELVFGRGVDTLFSEDLGACLCLAILDTTSWICGMATSILPEPPHSYTGDHPGRYASTAVPAIIKGIQERGGSIDFAATFLAGGSRVLPQSHCSISRAEIGERNIKSSVRGLREAGLNLIASDAGGQSSRALSVNLQSGEVVIRDNQGHCKLLYQLQMPGAKAA